MVGKNNIEALNRKTANKVNRYGIRRLSVGVASVAVAGLLFMADTTLVQAAEGDVSTETVADAETPLAEEPQVEEPQAEELQAEEPQAEEPQAEATSTEEAPAEATPAVQEFKLSDAQKASLAEAGYSDAEIASIEAEAKAQKVADENFNVDAFVAQKVAANKQIQTRSAETDLDLSDENAPEAVGAGEEAQPTAAPEETQGKNDLEEKGDKQRDKVEPTVNSLDFGLNKDGSIEEKKAEEAIANKAELKEAASYE